MRYASLTAAALLIALTPALLTAQTAPSTAPRPRYVVVIPPGFKTVTAGAHTAIVEPADEAWTAEFLQKLAPATLPTTMPTDLLANLDANREALKAQMIKDLVLSDPAQVDTFFKDKLQAELRKFDEIAPPLFYMVATRARLKELVKGGWTNPRFYYNRVADDIQWTRSVNLSTEAQADDVLVPIIVEADTPVEKRKEDLRKAINTIESDLAMQISVRAQVTTQVEIISFMVKEVFEPMKLKPDQEWFAVGLSGILSAHYVAKLNGMDPKLIVDNMIGEQRGNPFRPETIDLLHPTPQTEMRPQAIPYYADAFRRKSSRATVDLLSKSPDAAPKIIAELRKSVPADGKGLLDLIQRVTTVDLSQSVAASTH